MVRSYFILAIRNLFRHKMISVINVVGISIAIAFVILAFLFIQHEWTYDRFHANAHRIYRLGIQNRYAMSCNTPGPLGPAFAHVFPDAKVVRIYHSGGTLHYGAQPFHFITLKYVDSSFFDIFTIPLSKGDAETALRDLRSIVLTEEMAQKLGLGDQPIGKSVILYDEDYIVSGITSNIPKNSSIVFDGLLPFDSAGNPGLNSWYARDNTSTYMLLPEQADLQQIEMSMQDIIRGRWEEDTKLFFQPLGDIHFNQHIKGPEPTSSPIYSYVLLGIALIVVIIASVNFIALAIGRSSIRAKEVGIRKLVGAGRWHVIFQLMGESIVLSLLALCIGIGLAELLLPSFNAFTGMKLSLLEHWNISRLLVIVMLTLGVGVLAGLYPALILSRFQPVEILTVRTKHLSPGVLIRVMGVFQFAMSMALIMGAIAMVTQINFLKNKNLGFDPKNLVVIQGYGPGGVFDSKKLDIYKDRISSYPTVIGAAKTGNELSNKASVKGDVMAEGKIVSGVGIISVGYDYLKLTGFKLLEGRDFSKALETDIYESIIVNETFIKMFGWQKGVGKTMLTTVTFGETKIIGVVEDFHFRSLHAEVAPAVIKLAPDTCIRLLVRIAPNNVASTVDILKKEWEKVSPDIPFRFAFLEDNLASQYEKDQRWFHIIIFSAALAVCLACLGAFGLTTLSVARKTHEIGIRKIMGASVPHLMSLLSRDFIILVLIANAIAAPVAYYFTSEWLRAFAYQIGLTLPLLAGGILTLAVVLITVSIQTYRAATADSIQTLRHE